MNNLYIPDKERFELKLKAIKEGGLSKLHIISDFDRTLTKGFVDGKPHTTSWAIFNTELGEAYTKERQKLFDIYFPIEQDHTLNLSYKAKKMDEWWKQHMSIFVKHMIKAETIEKVIKNEALELREGVNELFVFSAKHDIPLLIFSAGIGDAIALHLKIKNLYTENIHILSNFFTFDESGHVSGFKDEVVHTLNKTEALIKTKPYADHIKEKINCILLGDSVHDVTMAEGMQHEAVLKIGFLNGVEECKKNFEEVYDAFLEKDCGIEDIMKILSMI